MSDTDAINKAIDAAAAVGGGTVFVSVGSYLCYSIHLKSTVELYLGAGATIIAADPPAPAQAVVTILPSQTPGTSFRTSGTVTGTTA